MRQVVTLILFAAGVVFSLASGLSSGNVDAGIARGDAAGGATDLGLTPNDSAVADAGGGFDSTTPARDAAGPVYDAAGPSQDAGGQPTTCSLDNIFFDQASTVCGAEQYCHTDQSYAAVCVANAGSAGGTYYGACGSNNECPVGSACFNPGTCYPFCSTSHETCPAGGMCVYGIEGGPADLKLCAEGTQCDAVDNTGCDPGEGCYVASETGNLCVTAGTGTAGTSCTTPTDCAPGFACLGAASPGTCTEMCHLESTDECSTGTCQNMGHPEYGACA